jgi:hypothetical protein
MRETVRKTIRTAEEAVEDEVELPEETVIDARSERAVVEVATRTDGGMIEETADRQEREEVEDTEEEEIDRKFRATGRRTGSRQLISHN